MNKKEKTSYTKRVAMKKILLIIPSIIIFSCSSDNLEEYYGAIDCKVEAISYSENIAPIISTNCAVSGCHVSGTGLPDWTSYQNVSANAQNIKAKTSAGEMPPSYSGRSITIEEAQMIACWADAGAPNN